MGSMKVSDSETRNTRAIRVSMDFGDGVDDADRTDSSSSIHWDGELGLNAGDVGEAEAEDAEEEGDADEGENCVVEDDDEEEEGDCE